MESPSVRNHSEDGGFVIFKFILVGGTSGNDDSNDICWGREHSLCTDNWTMCCMATSASRSFISVSVKPHFPQLFPLKDKWEEQLKTNGSRRGWGDFLPEEWKERDWWEQDKQLEKNMENPPSSPFQPDRNASDGPGGGSSSSSSVLDAVSSSGSGLFGSFLQTKHWDF